MSKNLDSELGVNYDAFVEKDGLSFRACIKMNNSKEGQELSADLLDAEFIGEYSVK